MTTNLETLSPRLRKVKYLISERRVADIGCDHGKLVYDLFLNDMIDYAFVSDISEPSLSKAVKLLSSKGYNFDYAVADGLGGIKPEYDIKQAVIAGMGGLEIIKILSVNNTNLKKFVLQPQNNELKLKKYLIKNGYQILTDTIVRERHMFYNIMAVEKTDKIQKLNEFELRFGESNFAGNMDFLEYLNYLNVKYTAMLKTMPTLKKLKVKKELNYVKKAYKKWGKIYETNVAISKNWYGVKKT